MIATFPRFPMFPLGGVLFPGAVLPLHVFEPRYRELVRQCLAGVPEFGVVLIERGSEVGGGDVRSSVGTRARILDAQELDDGRWVLMTAGVERIRVRTWLPDDPFPRADVEDWPDETPGPDDDLDAVYAEAVRRLRRVLALRAELGEPAAPATIELGDDPGLGSHHLAAMSTFGPADQQHLLAAPGPWPRLTALVGMLGEEAEVLGQRLALGD